MFRQSIRSIRPVQCFQYSRQFSITTKNSYSIIDTAKDKLNEINHKVGKVAADTIESAEQVTEQAKEKVEEVTETGEQAKNAYQAKGAEGLEEKAKETFGSETVEKHKQNLKDLKKKGEEYVEGEK